ncbi:MAG: diguanylate cyclase domain-containing protein [Pyrinomonadaceae bacterium]
MINENQSKRILRRNKLNDPAAADTAFAEHGAYKQAWERCSPELKAAHADLVELRNANAKLKQKLAERTNNEEALRRLAYHDTLTGLANRLLLREYLTHEIVQARRRKTRLAALFLDLDHFKNINDTLGHAAGDWMLQQVAARLTACVRAGDIVSRYAGDEFVLVLIDIGTLTHAVQIARRVIAQVSAPYPLNGHVLQVTASIGIAMYPESGQDFGSLVQNADAAMLGVKTNGRNHYQFVTDWTPNGTGEPVCVVE